MCSLPCNFFFFFSHTSTFQLLHKPWSQVSSLLSPRFLPSTVIAHRVQQSHCSSSFHRVLLTHALTLSASQFVHKNMSPRIYMSTHSGGGFERTKLIYTRLEDNSVCHHRRFPSYHSMDNQPTIPYIDHGLNCSSTWVVGWRLYSWSGYDPQIVMGEFYVTRWKCNIYIYISFVNPAFKSFVPRQTIGLDNNNNFQRWALSMAPN